ncbi:MAG: GGDEF domain-containing protein [Desulfovibrionales bacterium]|nr:MAG: GGDEF domain-containing protein [Desulfovibrionales bacterium]
MKRCFEGLCSTMDRLNVPGESKWRGLIVYMRSIGDYEFLTEEQREKTQELVMEVLKKRDFSEKAFQDLVSRNERILNDQWRVRLNEALQQTVLLNNQFQQLLRRRKEDVHELGERTLDTVRSELSLDSMVAEISSGFQKIEGLLQNDLVTIMAMSMTDALTKLNNRKAFDLFLDQAVEEALESGSALSMIFLDIDHFKQFNDEHGHLVGDQALIKVSALLKSFQEKLEKEYDRNFFSARFGGEEFVLLLPGMQGSDALNIAERLRRKIAEYNFLVRDANGAVLVSGVRVTISAGVAELHTDCRPRPDATGLVDRADKALYKAKHMGRNMVQRAQCAA